MEIRGLVERTGIPAKTIRYYESIGVLPPPERKSNGYRLYSEDDVERVRFVVGARSLGFSLDDIAEILARRDRRAMRLRFAQTQGSCCLGNVRGLIKQLDTPAALKAGQAISGSRSTA